MTGQAKLGRKVYMLAKFSRQSDRERMDPTGNYDADEVTVELDGAAISKGEGAKGRFVTIGPRKPNTTTIGTDGLPTLNVDNDRRRSVTITLLQTSSSNQTLSSARQKPDVTLLIKHADFVFEGSAWVESEPVLGAIERVWSLTANSN